MSPTEKEHPSAFDAWFAKNANVFESELLAEKHFLTDPENTVSIGCGTGLFEERHGIPRGVEPAEGMAGLARRGGIDGKIGSAVVHYYGAYSNAHRGVARRRKSFVDVPPEDEPFDSPRPDSPRLAVRRISWARLIRRPWTA